MSIPEALERAKAMHKARQQEKANSSPTPAISALTPQAFPDRTAPARSQGEPRPSIQRRTFDEIRYLPDVCIANRILVPELVGSDKSAAFTAYRMLRTRILQRARANGWLSLAITSPGPGEGKSVTSINLALSIAREKNSSVFLLDLDFRNPSLCAYLGVQPRHALTDYFLGAVPAEDTMFTIGVENLVVAGNIDSTTQSSELMATGKLENLFSSIQSWAPDPLVIIDLPPVLSTDEALQAAPRVSTTFLVVAEGKTRRDGVTKAMDLLREYNVAGIILNRAQEVVADYYSYSA